MRLILDAWNNVFYPIGGLDSDRNIEGMRVKAF